jgi:hypothetical protein
LGTGVWTGFKWLRIFPVADSCKHCNEPLGSIKCREFLYQLSDYQLLKDYTGLALLVALYPYSYLKGITYRQYNCLKIKRSRKHRVYSLKRNPTTITYYGTNMKPEAGPPPCNRLS